MWFNHKLAHTESRSLGQYVTCIILLQCCIPVAVSPKYRSLINVGFLHHFVWNTLYTPTIFWHERTSIFSVEANCLYCVFWPRNNLIFLHYSRWWLFRVLNDVLKVEFAAVNCWYDRGSCRQTYKFIRFPVLMLHQHTMSALTYTGRPLFLRQLSSDLSM